MSETLDLLNSHASVRSYLDKEVPDDVLDRILSAAQKVPSSINAQGLSLVVVREAETRQKIAELAGGQPWIAQAPVFIVAVIDYYKTALGAKKAGLRQAVHQSVEGLLVGAIDAGITLEALMLGARAEGLSIVPIGGIRRSPQEMIDLLTLPPLTFPVVGLCMGYGAKTPPPKPRMAIESFVHQERYNADVLPEAIDRYDGTSAQHHSNDKSIMEYWKRTGRKNGQSWSQRTAAFYQRVYFPHVGEVLRKQGFGFEG